MLRRRTRWALLLGFLTLGPGCRHVIPAPYARGQAPGSDLLLSRTGAQLPALQVSKAKVIANRTLRGNLAFIAEAPGRFRGTVQVAGNELVTLAFHEQGYALRYKMDAFPPGYYAGPPSACAVEALLGVSFDTKGLVDLVLGGAPVIPAPFEVIEQKWEKRGGYERLIIANDQLEQELRFGWVANDWRVVGGQLWERSGGQRGRRLWTMEHIELEPDDGVYLPSKTKVSTPGKRRDQTVVINYKERDSDPAFAKRGGDSGGGDGGDGGDDGDPWDEDDPWEDGDGWEDGAAEGDGDGGWEDGAAEGDGDGGWEDGAADTESKSGADPATAPKGDATAEGDSGGTEGTDDPSDQEPKPPKPETKSPEPEDAVLPPKKAKPKPAEPTVPPEFQLEPTGLTVRGDLCR